MRGGLQGVLAHVAAVVAGGGRVEEGFLGEFDLGERVVEKEMGVFLEGVGGEEKAFVEVAKARTGAGRMNDFGSFEVGLLLHLDSFGFLRDVGQRNHIFFDAQDGSEFFSGERMAMVGRRKLHMLVFRFVVELPGFLHALDVLEDGGGGGFLQDLLFSV